MKHVIVIYFIFFLSTFLGHSQSLKIPDSLLNKEYEFLSAQFYKIGDKNPEAEVYAKAYLKKGKLAKDTLHIISGYHLLADFHEKDYHKATKYVDSGIRICNGIKTRNYPAALYGKKAYIERYHGKFKNALDNYLKELTLIDSINNKLHFNYTNYNIALLKRGFGKYESAKTILKACLKYDVNNLKKQPKDSVEYLLTLTELVNTYRLNNEIDSALVLNNSVFKVAKNQGVGYLFSLNKGLLSYHKKEYIDAISNIESAIPELLKIENDYAFEIYNLIDAYFYLGKSHQKLLNKTEQLKYYKKVDSLILLHNYFVPEIKTVQLELINYYKRIGDRENQLLYTDKLIYSDSIIDSNYKYLSNKLNKEYDIPKLIEEKELIIVSMQKENKNISNTVIVIGILFLVSMLCLGFFYYKQRIYKHRFEELFKEKNTVKKPNIHKSIDISEEIITSIDIALQRFETKKEFLKQNLTLVKSAKNLGTNSKYLSIYINNYKGKSYSQYINDLRIEESIEVLKKDNKYRKYTIKAIANDFGFNTAEAFSKAFSKNTGINPSYFIKALNKNK